MINLDEINGEIAKLETQPTTLAVIERLSWLYIVRDHITLSEQKTRIVEAMPEGDSDFIVACRCGSVASVMGVMDELMDTIRVVQPRLYDAVLRKVQG